jgi:hypothetical protein
MTSEAMRCSCLDGGCQSPTDRTPPARAPGEPQSIKGACVGGRARTRRLLPRERFRCVLGMLSSLEVKVLRPT